MSNVKFNLNQFSRSISTLAAKSEDRPAQLAAQLGEAFEKASFDFLLSGSALDNTLNGAMSALACNGLKTGFAVKARKILKAFESFEGFAPWGHISNGEFIRLEGYIGGNATSAFTKAGINTSEETQSREMACIYFNNFVQSKVLEQFAVQAKDENAHIDPLASFGQWSEKTIDAKLASASIAEMENALERIRNLGAMINGAYIKAVETQGELDREAAKAVIEQAKIDAAKNAEVARVAAMQAELDAMRAKFEAMESTKVKGKAKAAPELLAA